MEGKGLQMGSRWGAGRQETDEAQTGRIQRTRREIRFQRLRRWQPGAERRSSPGKGGGGRRDQGQLPELAGCVPEHCPIASLALSCCAAMFSITFCSVPVSLRFMPMLGVCTAPRVPNGSPLCPAAPAGHALAQGQCSWPCVVSLCSGRGSPRPASMGDSVDGLNSSWRTQPRRAPGST